MSPDSGRTRATLPCPNVALLGSRFQWRHLAVVKQINERVMADLGRMPRLPPRTVVHPRVPAPPKRISQVDQDNKVLGPVPALGFGGQPSHFRGTPPFICPFAHRLVLEAASTGAFTPSTCASQLQIISIFNPVPTRALYLSATSLNEGRSVLDVVSPPTSGGPPVPLRSSARARGSLDRCVQPRHVHVIGQRSAPDHLHTSPSAEARLSCDVARSPALFSQTREEPIELLHRTANRSWRWNDIARLRASS
jgi:hypothetical protein